jgi:hypothetical protein
MLAVSLGHCQLLTPAVDMAEEEPLQQQQQCPQQEQALCPLQVPQPQQQQQPQQQSSKLASMSFWAAEEEQEEDPNNEFRLFSSQTYNRQSSQCSPSDEEEEDRTQQEEEGGSVRKIRRRRRSSSFNSGAIRSQQQQATQVTAPTQPMCPVQASQQPIPLLQPMQSGTQPDGPALMTLHPVITAGPQAAAGGDDEGEDVMCTQPQNLAEACQGGTFDGVTPTLAAGGLSAFAFSHSQQGAGSRNTTDNVIDLTGEDDAGPSAAAAGGAGAGGQAGQGRSRGLQGLGAGIRFAVDSSAHNARTPELVPMADLGTCGVPDKPPAAKDTVRMFDIFRPKSQRKVGVGRFCGGGVGVRGRGGRWGLWVGDSKRCRQRMVRTGEVSHHAETLQVLAYIVPVHLP